MVNGMTMINGMINHKLPRFEEKELKLGDIVGRGSFCTVIEIKNIELRSELSSDLDHRKRSNISNKCSYGTKYVMKKINTHDKLRATKSIQGLVIEAKFLTTLDHPNIMKIAATSINNFSDQSFLIMEQLSGTLEDKFVMWRNTESNIMSKISKTLFDPTGKKKKNFILQKYLVAYHLSSAMEYLHRSGIIHRDLKPENIGFNMKGQLQLYDFGLAKELDPKDNLMDGKGNYKLTGGTGTMRYMAPEVVKHAPYGLAADVFSFGIVLWQIMSCTIPYEKFSVEMYKKLVVYNGYRLDLNPSWPGSFSDLISRCWSHSSYERPEFDEVKDLLQYDLDSLGWKETSTPKEKRTHSRGSNISERKLSLRRLIAGAA